jgi:hypothetical protein
VAFCRVSYRDPEGIEHAVEVEGESLYEAVARAVNRQLWTVLLLNLVGR